MINIYKVEVSTNGRNSIVKTLDVDYKIRYKQLSLVRTILINSFSEELEEEVYIYLHYKDLEK